MFLRIFFRILLSFGFWCFLNYVLFVISLEITEPDDGFVQYNISKNWKILDDLKERTACPKCFRFRVHFCYNCFVPMPNIKNIMPQVELPFKIDIVKRDQHNLAQSTSVHAAVLAPKEVSIFNYPRNVPSYLNDGKTIVIYPGQNSSSIKEYLIAHPVLVRPKNESKSDVEEYGKIAIGNHLLELPFNRLLFVDGTWNKVKAVYKCFKELPCVVLDKRPSQFWRYQINTPRWYLATIEAVHQTLREILHNCAQLVGIPVSKCEIEKYDNLLFFFRHKYHVIHSLHKHDELLAYKRRMNL